MPSIGDTIDSLHALREQKRQLEEQVSGIAAKIEQLTEGLIEAMNKQGLESASGQKATVSISQPIFPSVSDWDAFYGYIHKTKSYHLLERRPAAAGCRELFELGREIPGVVAFAKTRLNVRSV